jgi:hypothetical protein
MPVYGTCTAEHPVIMVPAQMKARSTRMTQNLFPAFAGGVES